MATLQTAIELCEQTGYAETHLLLQSSDLLRHDLKLPAKRYETANELVAALNEQMASALPNGEARLNETNKVTLFATQPFRLVRLTSNEDAANYGALPAMLGFDANAERPYDYRVVAEDTPRALLVLSAIAKLEPKSVACAGAQAQGRGGAMRTRAYGTSLLHELVLEFIHEKEWTKLSLMLRALAKGECWRLEDGRGAHWRLRLADGDSEPQVTRSYSQAPYLRVSLSVVEEP